MGTQHTQKKDKKAGNTMYLECKELLSCLKCTFEEQEDGGRGLYKEAQRNTSY